MVCFYSLCFLCSRGNPEEITRKYHETKEAYKDIRVKVKHHRKFLEVCSVLEYDMSVVFYIKTRSICNF